MTDRDCDKDNKDCNEDYEDDNQDDDYDDQDDNKRRRLGQGLQDDAITSEGAGDSGTWGLGEAPLCEFMGIIVASAFCNSVL